MKDIIVLGIAGGTGSGKTTITNRIAEYFGNLVTVLYHDSYYRAHHELTYEERVRLNYDHPDAFENERMAADLMLLKEGRSIECPIYDYTIYDRSNEVKIVHPAPIIIVEGIMIFYAKEIRDLIDIRIFVDTDADERILRRIMRDVKERGRSLDSVVKQYLTTVKPMHEAFVEPTKRYADIIVPEGGKNQVAIDMIMNRMQAHLDRNKGLR